MSFRGAAEESRLRKRLKRRDASLLLSMTIRAFGDCDTVSSGGRERRGLELLERLERLKQA
jgi:hypothetical protein